MTTDEKWMRRALALAQRGQGAVHPNPMVGAVLVKKGRVVGEGFHRAFGQAHAEVEALQRAGARARGATLYVTLEPCAHFGKTPPCVQAVKAAGVKRVVSAMGDPNPLVAGKGHAILKRAKISVTLNVEKEKAMHLNRAFVMWVTQRRPYVTLKMATSFDGKMATSTGDSQWITGPESRSAGHRLRAEVDAIAVGINTALQDDPSLTAHGHGRDPIRVVFDRQLRLSSTLHLSQASPRTWIFTGEHISPEKKQEFEALGLRVESVPLDRQGRLSLSAALKQLAQAGVAHLLVEGGARLQTSFFEEHLVDEVVWFIAPLWIGTHHKLQDAERFEPFTVESRGTDLRLVTTRRSVKD